MILDRQGRGAHAEEYALQYLRQQGLDLVARNWSCPQGELDLVMCHAKTLVFVEVRYRRHQSWGGPLASVDSHKQRRLIQAACAFLQAHTGWRDAPCRFDVVALTGNPVNYNLDWISNAFDS